MDNVLDMHCCLASIVEAQDLNGFSLAVTRCLAKNERKVERGD